MANAIGEFIVDFHDELGKGTFGNVYKATHTSRKTPAAAKKISFSEEGIINKKMQSMAEKEFLILEQLQDHPNIVRLLGQYSDQKNLWLFMERCDLDNLSVFMKKYEPDIRGKLKIMHECASAIHFMHNKNPQIVHRDIKPANVLMTLIGSEAVVKVSDFGMGKILARVDMSKHQTMETMAGTKAFMAPEFFKPLEEDAHLKYHPSIDTFSLGLLFLVVFMYNKENPMMIPNSARTQMSQVRKECLPIGKEMFLAITKGTDFPKLFKDDFLERKDLQKLITSMCAYKDCDRTPLVEVKTRFWQLYGEV